MNISVYMGRNAVIIVDSYDVGIVFLNQPVFHPRVIGLPQLPNDFFALVPNFQQCLVLDVCLNYKPFRAV